MRGVISVTNKKDTKEEVVVSAEKEPVKKPTPKKKPKPLEPRIHYREFLSSKKLSPERQAGFLAFCEGKHFMRRSEWDKKYKEYIK